MGQEDTELTEDMAVAMVATVEVEEVEEVEEVMVSNT